MGLLGIAIIGIFGWMILSSHALTAHANERWSAERVYQTISAAANDPENGVCRPLIVAHCPLAIARTNGSTRFGEISPQVRVFCQIDQRGGIMGVFGIWPRVYITGYYIGRARFEQLVRLDSCVERDITWLRNFLIGN